MGKRLAVALLALACHAHEAPASRVVLVTAGYPGAAAADVESQVVDPLEQALSQLEGVAGISSTAQEGTAIVAVNFASHARAQAMLGKIHDQVTSTRSRLPPAIFPLVQAPAPPVTRTLRYVLAAPTLSRLELSDLDRNVVREKVERTSGVHQRWSCGDVEEEIAVTIAPDRAAVATDVRASLGHQADIPGGRIDHSGTQATIRVAGEAWLRDLSNLAIHGTSLRIGDVATVAVHHAPPPCTALARSGPLIVGWLMTTDASVQAARRAFDEARARLPPGVTLVVSDASQDRAFEVLLPPGTSDDEQARVANRLLREDGTDALALLGTAVPNAPGPRVDGLTLVVSAGASPRDVAGAIVRRREGELRVVLSGEDRDALRRLATDVAALARKEPGVVAAGIEGGEQRPAWNVVPDQARSTDLGLDITDVATTVILATGGLRVGHVITDGRSLPIRLRVDGVSDGALRAGARDALVEMVSRIHVRARDGQRVPLGEVVRVSEELAPTRLLRRDRYPAVEVWVSTQPGTDRAKLARRVEGLVAAPAGIKLVVEMPS